MVTHTYTHAYTCHRTARPPPSATYVQLVNHTQTLSGVVTDHTQACSEHLGVTDPQAFQVGKGKLGGTERGRFSEGIGPAHENKLPISWPLPGLLASIPPLYRLAGAGPNHLPGSLCFISLGLGRGLGFHILQVLTPEGWATHLLRSPPRSCCLRVRPALGEVGESL